jgi:tetratricopeptide (TPR) repeat protein
MVELHVTRALLEAVVRGDLPARALAEVAQEHLMNLCPDCRSEIEAFRAVRREPVDYHEAFARVYRRLEAEAPAIEAERRATESELADLLALTPEARLRRVGRSRRRFRSRALVERLLTASREAWTERIEESFHLAALAEVVHRRSGGPDADALRAHALALKGNARRALGDLHGADRDLSAGRRLAREGEITDTFVCAELDSLEGVLRRHQRRFGEAEELLARAAVLYSVVGQEEDSARALLALAITYGVQGLPQDAGEAVSSALRHLDAAATPVLYLRARFHQAHFLHDAGEHRQARQFLTEDAVLYAEHADDLVLRHLRWLEAKIAMGLDEDEDAEAALLAVREALGDHPLDQAHVGLDLALLYLKQGRLAEVKEVAAEAVALFQAQAVHREALGALLLFREAADRELLTRGLVRNLGLYFEQAKADPGLRFEQPS